MIRKKLLRSGAVAAALADQRPAARRDAWFRWPGAGISAKLDISATFQGAMPDVAEQRSRCPGPHINGGGGSPVTYRCRQGKGGRGNVRPAAEGSRSAAQCG